MNCRPYSTIPPGRTPWWRKLAVLMTVFTLFATAATAQYCNSNFTNVTYEFITNVTYAGINNTSAGTIGGGELHGPNSDRNTRSFEHDLRHDRPGCT
ncbi:MAG: hypothetical protein IPG69_02970 [Flavobacteriales bacterium]|nr:hypothetical protein [Flavobacteriales bacterium]